MKNLFKRKKDKFPTESAPRSMEEITKEHNQALYDLGKAQYMVYVHTQDLEQVNRRLVAINQEGAARQALDRANADKKKVEDEAAALKKAELEAQNV